MILGIIPARYASTRFPGKPLALIHGRTMIQRVYEQAAATKRLDQVVVATDDERIAEHVLDFGGFVHMTRSDHPSGTDRCAEVAQRFQTAELIINIQGDEPFIQPAQIDLLANSMVESSVFSIGTLAKRITEKDALFNPNVVKVVFSAQQGALYFSRHPIPFLRNETPENWLANGLFYKHIGLYAYRRDTLLEIAGLQPSPLEKAESLEQLRWIENGHRILVAETELETAGIDTPEDLEKVNA